MTLLKIDNQAEFYPKDLRGQLRAWIRDQGIDKIDYLKPEVALYRLNESLSIDLAERGKRDSFGLSKLFIKDEIRECGKTGEFQKNRRTGETRSIGHYCNHRRYHIPCAQRYRRGQAVESRSAFMEIIKARSLWGLWHWTFTLPEHVRAFIENSEIREVILKDVRRAVSKTIKEVLGINTKTRNSGNPFINSYHFHSIILPLLLDRKNNISKTFKKQISHIALKEIYKKHLDQVLKKYSIPYDVKNNYVLYMRYISKNDVKGLGHCFFYNNRSQIDDVLKTIKRVHVYFENFICALWNKKDGVYIPCVKDRAEVLDALENILNPPLSIRQSYGFMRVLDKYALQLCIERDEIENQADEWETLYKIEIRRDMVKIFDDEYLKVRPLASVYIRKADSADAWRKIKPDELKGERVCLCGRKFFKARCLL
jgi:hypothetical protein